LCIDVCNIVKLQVANHKTDVIRVDVGDNAETAYVSVKNACESCAQDCIVRCDKSSYVNDELNCDVNPEVNGDVTGFVKRVRLCERHR